MNLPYQFRPACGAGALVRPNEENRVFVKAEDLPDDFMGLKAVYFEFPLSERIEDPGYDSPVRIQGERPSSGYRKKAFLPNVFSTFSVL